MESDQQDEDKISKIKKIIEREFEKEIISKQDEVMEITEKIEKVLRNLDILKYVVTVNYYENNSSIGPKKIGDQEDDSKEEKVQNQIHPCVKKLLPFRSNYVKSFGGDGGHSYETRKNKQSMVYGEASSTVTKEEESTKAEEVKEERVTQMPQYIPPRPNPDAVKEVINSQRGGSSKVKHRIIVGNISKWIPPDTREDKSTHKWMVYVRNQDKDKNDVTRHIRKVRYFLHESYKPHDIIDVTSSPFHLTRRGWGEFPVRVQLHFRHPLNKPVDIIHNLKLDMTCSGVQTLGAETVVEVCLHESSASNEATQPKRSITHESEYANGKKTAERADVFDGTLLMPVNGIKSELTSEDDRANEDESAAARGDGRSETTQSLLITNNSNLILDRRKLQEIIDREHDYCKADNELCSGSESSILRLINGELNRNGVIPRQFTRKGASRIEVSMSRGENEIFRNLKSVASSVDGASQSKYCMKTFKQSYLVNIIQRVHATRLRTVEALLKWFFRRWPIVTKLATDPTYKHIHPYSCPSEEEFFQYNIGKQRSAEWFRAKAIQKILISLKPLLPIDEDIWTTKQILTWSRFHGYSPISCPQKPSAHSGYTSEGESSKRLSDTDTETDEPGGDACPRKGKSSKFAMNGLSLGPERKRNFKRGRKKGLTVDEESATAKSYRHASAYSEPGDATRFGALDYRVLERTKAPEIDVVTVVDDEDDRSDRNGTVTASSSGQPTNGKRRDVTLTVATAPPDEVAMNRFVAGATRQIGIRLTNEEVVPGVMCDSVVRVMSQAAVTFVDELLRKSLAQAWMRNNDRAPSSLEYDDVLATLMETPQFDVFTNRGLGIQPAIKMEQ